MSSARWCALLSQSLQPHLRGGVCGTAHDASLDRRKLWRGSGIDEIRRARVAKWVPSGVVDWIVALFGIGSEDRQNGRCSCQLLITTKHVKCEGPSPSLAVRRREGGFSGEVQASRHRSRRLMPDKVAAQRPMPSWASPTGRPQGAVLHFIARSLPLPLRHDTLSWSRPAASQSVLPC
ncbi:hypothetical protein B0J11DRAFT_540627 [Dendryphion nanum]|uniref:Uncharacterized protein n=1 Tax=Dendryphion nanum TaxID=256645 RepID=A0A9P9D8F9_9PLEO|nr:hypothetical protein B0J11DRAFT_540627 [Dendryphion nanum]